MLMDVFKYDKIWLVFIIKILSLVGRVMCI